MRIHVNKANEQIVQTPFGNIEMSLLKQILPRIGIRWNQETDSWAFKSTNTHRKDDKTGKDLWLPLRAFNFEIALHQAKKEAYTDEEWRLIESRQDGDKLVKSKDPSTSEVQRAMAYNYEDKYLPEILNEKSYSALFRKVGLE